LVAAYTADAQPYEPFDPSKPVLCRRFIAGVFLACGSAVNPDLQYYLDLNIGECEKCDFVGDILQRLNLPPKVAVKRGKYFLYFKQGESVINFLALVNADNCAMRVMNARIYKEITNNVNRTVNCDTANIGKTAGSAAKLCDDINYIFERGGKSILTPDLMIAAKARAENVDLPQSELCEMLGISKSMLHRRFAELSEIADRLRKENLL
jgi:DNA-binding protein WhiA